MKVVVDTNVVIFGVFFKGPPYLALLVAQSSIVDPIEPSPAIVIGQSRASLPGSGTRL